MALVACKRGKNFNLWRHKLKFLPVRGRKAATRPSAAGARLAGTRHRRERVGAPGALRGRAAPRSGASLHRCRRKRLRPAETPAVKGRWAGVPIDPAAYGSCSSAFALRNLHKSPGREGWVACCTCGGFASCGRPQQAAIGAGFVRLVAGYSRLRPAGAPGCTSRARPRRRPPLAVSARRLRAAERAPGCTFFEVRCRRVGSSRIRAHFLRFVAAEGTLAGRGGRLSGKSHSKSAGQRIDESKGHNLKRERTAREGEMGARACNEPQKMCTKRDFADARPYRTEARWGLRYEISKFDALAGRLRAQPEARRTKPAPIAAGRRALAARMLVAGPARAQPVRTRRFVEVS